VGKFIKYIKMKFNININQKGVIDNNLNVDIIDMAILDYFKSMMMWPMIIKETFDNQQYFFISPNKIIDDMPILGITSTRGINKRLDKLIEANLIKRCPYNQKKHKSFFCMGDNYIKLEIEGNIITRNESSNSLGTEVLSTRNESSNNNNIDNNNIEDNKEKILKESGIISTNTNVKHSNRTDEEFEKVWKLYDRKGSKKMAKPKWMKLSDEDVSKCISYIKALKSCTERQYWKDFERLLKAESWNSKLAKGGYVYYDPEQTQESIDLNEAIRGETMYPKTKDGIYISHSENPMLDIVFDGYKNDNRPDGCKIMYCGIIFEWNKEEKKFKKQENR